MLQAWTGHPVICRLWTFWTLMELSFVWNGARLIKILCLLSWPKLEDVMLANKFLEWGIVSSMGLIEQRYIELPIILRWKLVLVATVNYIFHNRATQYFLHLTLFQFKLCVNSSLVAFLYKKNIVVTMFSSSSIHPWLWVRY